MEIYIEGLGREKVDILIDIANTENVALKVETEYRDWLRRGIIPTIMYTNFPILNKNKNLSNDLQKEIASLISKNIELERKLLSIELDKAYENSFKNMKLKPAEVAELIKIVDEEQRKKSNGFWERAKKKCVEYLESINSNQSSVIRVQSKQVFAQYIARNRKKLNSK